MTTRINWLDKKTCLCGVWSCTCLPDPQGVKLKPGERILFGCQADISSGIRSVILDRIWLFHGNKNLVSASVPKHRVVNGFHKLLEILLRKTVHLPDQDEKTRAWATEKLMELPSLFREVTS